ncbi:hypothetical protein ABID70_000949 [Clavibacter michiganensis]|uniref:hypothetical protein n=1 Tax=Clavibacter michiganensis TaxID=28447 RepID=UPI001AE65088|nr:hypothetical protein [Clavibacter michiganensis]MBP2458390.1 hypothetical protein [Clavibacter michiganensis]MDQ0410961.1 hypothetical protein [Clavibacter michiganensis]
MTVVVGSRDPFSNGPGLDLVRHLPGVEVHVVPGADHTMRGPFAAAIADAIHAMPARREADPLRGSRPTRRARVDPDEGAGGGGTAARRPDRPGQPRRRTVDIASMAALGVCRRMMRRR